MDLTPEPPMPEQVTCVGYARVSTEHQAGEVYTSLADQEAAIHELAARLEVTVGRVFRDAGASGATAEGRPAFLELLNWCEETVPFCGARSPEGYLCTRGIGATGLHVAESVRNEVYATWSAS